MFLLWLLFLKGVLGVDYYSPYVFNFYFYLNTNYGLIQNGILTEAQAKTHWINTGINAGLQGCGSFHTQQYLQRYPDVAAVYGATNWSGAIDHYLTYGRNSNEKRLGYVEGGAFGRYTISNGFGGVHLSASTRMGWAIDSLVGPDGTEYINAYDHGRLFQYCHSLNGHSECEGITEGGSKDDGATSSTNRLNMLVSGNYMNTRSQGAYWLQVGEADPNPSPPYCVSAANTQDVSTWTTEKAVEIESNNLISYHMIINAVEATTQIQFEAPTAYLNWNFQNSYLYDRSTGPIGTATPLNSQAYFERPQTPDSTHLKTPIIYSDASQQHALGIWGYIPGVDPNWPNLNWIITWTNGFFDYGAGTPTGSTVKATVVLRVLDPVPANTQIFVQSYICIGTLVEVQTCLYNLP